MITNAAVYFLVLIVGNTRIELVSKPPLTLEQCYTAGEAWARRGSHHTYECRKIQDSK